METPIQNNQVCLAVLPLQVLSEDPHVNVFCQGLVMDLITDLSRFRPFEIIAFQTTRELTPTEVPDSDLLTDLNLDYLVKGMARYTKDILHLNLQLINVRQNRVVWSEKFDGSLDEFFRIEDEVTEKTVGSLQQFVDMDLLSDLRKKPLTKLNAYECWLKGYEELQKGTIESDGEARRLFEQAISIDPHYARAYSGVSLSYFNEWSCQLWSRWDVSRSGAQVWAEKALALDERDHVSNAILGRVFLYQAEYEKAEHFLRKSLRINPNDPETLLMIIVGFTFLGYCKEAGELLERAVRLNPAQRFCSFALSSFVEFERGNFETSISLAEQHQLGTPWVDFPAYLAAAHFHLGNESKMHTAWNIFLAEFSQKINGGKPVDTQTALEWMVSINPYRGETRLKPFWIFMGLEDPERIRETKPDSREATPRNQFTRSGSLWTLSFKGEQYQLSDLKGFHNLASLLARPRESIHCTELMGARVIEKGNEVFDEQARSSYRRQIKDLQEAIQSTQDGQQLTALHEEYDQLVDHLARITGKGGRARKVSGTVEKCRAAVTLRIRSAVKKIAEVHPALGKHLTASIKTGVYCEYSPEHETSWSL